jgi:hypothetical protein
MCCAAVCWQPPVYVAFFYLSCCCLPLVHGRGLRKPLQRCFHPSHAASLPVHRVGKLRTVIRPIIRDRLDLPE